MELDAQERLQLKQTVETLCDMVNVIGQDNHRVSMVLAQNIESQHRTLQQSIIGVLVGALDTYGSIAASDARNEVAVQLCQDIHQMLADKDWLTYGGEVKLPLV